MPNPTAYPLFGTGVYFAVASGTGTPDDPYVPAIELTAPPGYIANPLVESLDAAGFYVENAGIPCAQVLHTDGSLTSYPASADTDAAAGTAIIAAKTAAASGDTIYVYRSAEVTANLAQDGVNWWFAPGVTVTKTSGSGGLFDDGGSAVSYAIGGDGTLAQSTTDSDGTITVNHTDSVVSIKAKSIQATHPTLGTAVSAIYGTLTIDLTDGIVGSAVLVNWKDCDTRINSPHNVKTSIAGIYGAAIIGFPIAAPTGNFYFDSESIVSAGGGVFSLSARASDDLANGRMYVRTKRFESDSSSGISIIDSGGIHVWISVEADELIITADRQGTNPIDFTTSGIYFVRARRFYPNTDGIAGGSTPIHAAGGLVFIDIDDIDDGAGICSDNSVYLVDDASASMFIGGRSLQLANAADGIKVTNGTVSVAGLEISTQSGSSDLIRTGGTLKVGADVSYSAAKTSGTITLGPPFGGAIITTSTITTVANVVTALNALITALGFSHN